jgi:MFS family permease
MSLFTRSFVLAAIAHAMLNIAGFLFVHLPGFLQELGAGEAEIGRIMATQALGAILAWPFVGRAMDAHGRRIVILAGVALFTAVVALYLTVHGLGFRIYAVRLLDGVAATMWYTALFTYAADLIPPERRTEGLALFGVSGLVPLGLSAQFGEVILAYAGYRELFLGALVFAFAGLLLCLPLRDVRTDGPTRGVPPRNALATAAQRDLLPVWIAGFTFFVAAVALFTFMKTFVVTTGTGSVEPSSACTLRSPSSCGSCSDGSPTASVPGGCSASPWRCTRAAVSCCRLPRRRRTSCWPGCCAAPGTATRFRCCSAWWSRARGCGSGAQPLRFSRRWTGWRTWSPVRWWVW